MWCRTILTAVAISYVICMLLWSGLQKEDLDASTLEKLRRYNVNIDDMNNEQRRQECLLDQITTEVQREALRTSATNDLIADNVNVGIYPKIGMLLAANFEDKTVVQFHSNDTKGNFEDIHVNAQKQPDLANVTTADGNKAVIKIEYNVQNQPDVESVMNFWAKLTHRTSTVATLPTTLVAPVVKIVQKEAPKSKNGVETTQAETRNDGYVHSREMEYISRILAEYLVSQAVPSTTESVSTKKVFAHYVPIKYWEISNKTAFEEKSRVDELGDDINKINATQDNLRSDKVMYNSMIDKGKSKPHKVTFDSQLMKMIQETMKSKPKVRESKLIQRSNTNRLIQRLLRMKHDLFNNGIVIPETEFEIKTTNKSNDKQDKSKPFNLFYLFQNINDVNKTSPHNFIKNNDKSTSASIKTETMVTYEPEIEVGLTYIKKSLVLQNPNFEHRRSRFRDLLPSIKHSKQNINMETQNSQVIGTPTELNKSAQHENDEVELFSVKKAVVSRQPAAIEKFAKNQLFKMKNDTFNSDTETTSNIAQTSKELTDNQLKKVPVLQKLEPTYDSKAMKEIISKYGRDNEELTPLNVQDLKPIQNVDSTNTSDVQAIPASVIKEIAENVKRMVLKDIGENTTTTTVKTTTAETTLSTSTITTSEPPSTSLQQEFTKTNLVIQKLMEIFKELKALKDTDKLANQIPQNTSIVSNGTTILPQLLMQPLAPASFNPYLMQTPNNFKPIQANPYTSNAKISSGANPLQNMGPQFLLPLSAQPTKDYHFGAITIQTNSDEIAPLAIQISKPLKLMHQQIVLTTKRTVDRIKEQRERESMKHIEDKFRIPNEERNHREDQFRNPNEKRNHREKLEIQSDLPKNVQFAEKHEVRDQYSYRGRYLDREKPLYHEYHEKVHNIEHPVRSRFPELRYPGRLTHLEHSGRPRDLSTSDDSSPPRGYNRPGFNEPGNHKSGIRHHPGLYSHATSNRQPRYEATKFHEKLERIENWPRNTWKDFHSPSDSSNDEVPARQQMPLVKAKKRKTYDDTHFANFLKSQQKVTDMLEKILTSNLKNNGPYSVETTYR